jgi:hypothetical protein
MPVEEAPLEDLPGGISEALGEAHHGHGGCAHDPVAGRQSPPSNKTVRRRGRPHLSEVNPCPK